MAGPDDHPAGAQSRFRSTFVGELRLREEAARRWEPIWAEAGIALAHHAIADVPGSGHRPSAPMALIHGMQDGRLQPGDLVAVRDSGVADDANQHLRRVSKILPGHDGGPTVSVLLGEAVPRHDWPDAMLRGTTPIDLESHVRGEAVRVTRSGATLVDIQASGSDTGIWKGYVDSLIRQAARNGKEDALGGGAPAFSVKAGRSGSGARIWQVEDSYGRSYANDMRGLLQRRPPERIEALLKLTKAAYLHAWTITRTEDMLLSQDPEPDASAENDGAGLRM